MTFMEQLIIEANKTIFKKAREKGNLNEVILATIAEDKETRINYLINNEIITSEELNLAINK